MMKLLQTQRELNCSEYIDARYTTIRHCQFVDQNVRPLSQNTLWTNNRLCRQKHGLLKHHRRGS